MRPRAVYDMMVFFQWATLPPEQPHRQHATLAAVINRTVRLCLGPELLFEVQNLLTRPELQVKYKSMTPEHVAAILSRARRYAVWFENIPKRFALPNHEKDNHLFDLAIEAKADYLVTFERRLLALPTAPNQEGHRLRELAPSLEIITPKSFAELLKAV
ncbi:MAG TPA: putative toxin-antitoxin system toxin component, PIN family [Tepidisphaeraceae bacterium]|nr:putative toxin-antitoxin system toxin component, PIN family [Tepidisphaeraceae bacterium]